MKEFFHYMSAIFVVGVIAIILGIGAVSIYTNIDCHMYGKMTGLEYKTGIETCYVYDNGDWIDKSRHQLYKAFRR